MRVRSVRRTDLKSLTPQNKQLKISGGIVSNPRVSATNEQYLPKAYSETAWIACLPDRQAARIFNCVVLKLMICSLDFWFFALRQRTFISMILNILQCCLIHNSYYINMLWINYWQNVSTLSVFIRWLKKYIWHYWQKTVMLSVKLK